MREKSQTEVVQSNQENYTWKVNNGTGEKEKFLDNSQVVAINHNVLILGGRIINNPFAKKMNHTEAVHWVINNENMVKNRIRGLFREYNVTSQGGNVGDCFGKAIDYFSKPENAFKKDYFGKNTSYTVKDYCLKNIQYIVKGYLKTLIEKNPVSLLTTDEFEGKGYGRGVLESTLADKKNSGLSIEENLDILNDEEHMIHDAVFFDLYKHGVYFISQGYKPFDIYKYVEHMYLNIEDHVYKDIDKHIKIVASRTGEPEDFIRLLMDDLKENKDDELAKDFLNDIYMLVRAKAEFGWEVPQGEYRRRREKPMVSNYYDEGSLALVIERLGGAEEW